MTMYHTMTLNRRHITIAAAGVLALTFAASPAMAKPAKWPDMSKDMPAMTQSFAPQIRNQTPPNLGKWAQRRISASDAKAIARRRVPGAEVVDISLQGDTWRVRLIRKDGRVVDVSIDATTGRVRN